jgi:hypothetical protein
VPHGAELFAQGKLEGLGSFSAYIQDEQREDKRLLCDMKEAEFDEVIHLYLVGKAVQVLVRGRWFGAFPCRTAPKGRPSSTT